MNANKSDSKAASTLIRGVLNNILSAETALAQWPIMTKGSEKTLKGAYHLMQHFLSDDDIRARDVGYNAAQRKALEKAADDLLAQSVK